jgi:thiamine pyrophosphokinase
VAVWGQPLELCHPAAYRSVRCGMRCLVIANGECPSVALLKELTGRAALTVAADGGANVALAAGMAPDAVVGDLDSVTAESRAALGEARVHLDDDIDATDLEKAIRFALARGATDIDVVAAGGGRADHAMANLSVLTRFRGRADIRIIDDLFEIRLVAGRAEIDAEPGTVISLISVGRCTGVSTEGLRWPLSNFTLDFSPRGVHNEVASRPASVSVTTGDLLLFQGRWVERHA